MKKRILSIFLAIALTISMQGPVYAAGTGVKAEITSDAGTNTTADTGTDATASTSVDTETDVTADTSVDTETDATAGTSVDTGTDVTADTSARAIEDATAQTNADQAEDAALDASAAGDNVDANDAGSVSSVDAAGDDALSVEGQAVEPEDEEWNEPPVKRTEEIEIPESETGDDQTEEPDTYLSAASEAGTEINLMQAISKKVRTAILNRSATIDLRQYHINRNGAEMIPYIGYYCPYFDGKKIKASLYYSGNQYTSLYITYNLSAAAIRTWVTNIDTALAEIYTVIGDGNLTAIDRALKLHDFMAAHYHYDTSYENYYPGIMLSEHLGVCQSYAYLFQYVMNTKGIACYTVHSSTHAWNILYLNDQFYNIDVTWDDPVNDRYGQTRHDYFMITDTTLVDGSHDTNGSHNGRNMTDIVCADPSYEDDYFAEADSPIILKGNDRYYLKETSLVKYDTASDTSEILDSLGYWHVWGQTSYYTIAFSGLSEYEDCLYYNTADAIKYYNLDNQQVYTYMTPDTTNGYIYGSVFYGNRLSYVLQQDTSVNYPDKNIQETKLACHGALWDTGVVTSEPTCIAKGRKTYTCIKCGETKSEELAIVAHTIVTDPAVAATVFTKGKTAGKHCQVCKKVFTAQKATAKLKPTIKLSKTSVTLKKKKSIKIKVSSLARGDYISYWRTSNKKVASITGTGVIKGVKKGKATVTVVLKSGKKGTIKVKVK